jgi:hypothetical protein
MHYLSDFRFLTGAFTLILAAINAFSVFRNSRRSEEALLVDYFGPGYERDLLEQSSLSETEDWQADRPSRGLIDLPFQSTPSK